MEIHIGTKIREELDRQQHSVAWFARTINCTRPHAYRIFKKDNIDIKLLTAISRALNHDFFQDISQSENIHTRP